MSRADRRAAPAARHLHLCLLSAAAALLAAACGSASDAGYRLDVSPAALEFTADVGAPLPAAQVITATFKGDGLLVGFPAGTTPPAWLDLTADPQTSSPAAISVRPNGTGMAPGDYTATVRLLTGKVDGSVVVMKDVPVTYRVRTGLASSPASLAFSTVEGTAPEAQSVTVSSDRLPAAWTLSVSPASADWLVLPTASGTVTGAPAVVPVEVAARPPGTYAATLALRDGAGQVRRTIPVTYQVRALRGLEASPASLSFTAVDGAAPAAREITLTSEVLPMDWSLEVVPVAGKPIHWVSLPVIAGRLDTSPAQVTIGALPQPPGAYAATLRVLDGSGAEKARIPLAYQVTPAFSVPASLSATITHAATWTSLDLPFSLQPLIDPAVGAGARWQVTSNVPWLTVSPASGDLAGPTALVASLDAAKLWALPNGAHAAVLSVQFSAGGLAPASIPVTLSLSLAPALAVTAPAPFQVTGSAAPADLARSVAISSNLGPAFASHGTWQGSSGAAWLTVTPTGAGSARLDLAPAGLAALANGTHQGTVTIQPDSPRVAAASTSASLTLTLPEVRSVAPYTAWVGQGGAVVVRGVGFAGATTRPVSFGTAPAVDGQVVSDTELRAVAPPQAEAGRVRVAVGNTLGLDRAAAELVVLPAPGYLGHQATFTKAYTRMTLDPERQAVLLTGSSAGEVRRLRFAAGAWGEDAFVAPSASGVGVLQDGKALVATAGSLATSDVFFRLDPETFSIQAQVAASDYYERYDYVAPFADGRTLLVDTDQWANTFWYPGLTSGAYIDAHYPAFVMTRDRSRLIVYSQTTPTWSSLDAGQSRSVARAVTKTIYSTGTFSVSGDGGRLVVGDAVYDRDFAFLGVLQGASGVFTDAVSPDGTAVYTLGQVQVGTAWVWELRRTDISAAAGPYPTDAELLPFTLGDETPLSMMVSEDGSCLFLLTRPKSTTGTIFRALPLP